ncbi:riboflavin synthase [Candidatus Pacebacteria bacterium]|nr:riboflavin synthase [Candidatus Paceibacterota bacterium]
MFTGIIETTQTVRKQETSEGVLSLEIVMPDGWQLALGQSIAVNGACLTVVSFDSDHFVVELVPETLEKTIFGESVPTAVNLERAMLPTDRFEGHIVQGHIDTVGEVQSVLTQDNRYELAISFTAPFTQLVVPKGSITIDGVSLTITNMTTDTFSVALIPHTLRETTLGTLREGDKVNLEFDIVGKYLVQKNRS